MVNNLLVLNRIKKQKFIIIELIFFSTLYVILMRVKSHENRQSVHTILTEAKAHKNNGMKTKHTHRESLRIENLTTNNSFQRWIVTFQLFDWNLLTWAAVELCVYLRVSENGYSMVLFQCCTRFGHVLYMQHFFQQNLDVKSNSSCCIQFSFESCISFSKVVGNSFKIRCLLIFLFKFVNVLSKMK